VRTHELVQEGGVVTLKRKRIDCGLRVAAKSSG
jgi:hypothetical protein